MKTKDIQTVLEEVIRQASVEAKRNNVSVHLKGSLKEILRREFTDINATYRYEDNKLEFDVIVTPEKGIV